LTPKSPEWGLVFLVLHSSRLLCFVAGFCGVVKKCVLGFCVGIHFQCFMVDVIAHALGFGSFWFPHRGGAGCFVANGYRQSVQNVAD